MLKKILIGLLVGASFLGVGIFMLSTPHDDYLPVVATIVEIQETWTGDNEYAYEVYVDYTVDGTAYRHVRLGNYSSGYREGKEINLFYNPANPSQIEAGGRGIWGIALTAVGGLIFLFSLSRLLYPLLQRRRCA